MNIASTFTLQHRLREHNATWDRQQGSVLLRLLLPVVVLLAITTGLLSTTPVRAELGVDGPLSAQQRALYKKAFAEAKAGRIGKARSLLNGEQSRLACKLATWLYYTRSSRPAPFAEITNFIENNPDWPAQRALRQAAETAISNAAPTDQVLNWFSKNPPVSVAARIRLADAFFTSGQPNLGEVLVRQIWISNNLPRSIERSFYQNYRKILTKDDHAQRLDRLLWDRRRGAANRMLSRVPPDHRKLGFARLSLIGSAAGVDTAIAKVPPQLINHPALTYERVHWRRTKGFNERARELLWNPPQQLGRPKKWWRERRTQVRLLLRQGHVSEAYRMAAAHGQVERAQIAEAEWLAGWIALSFLKDASTALGHFARGHAVVRFPISVARMGFWAGRAAQASGRPKVADTWYGIATQYPMTFYGQLAMTRLDKPVPLTLPASPTPTPRSAKGFSSHEIVQATKLWAAMGDKRMLRRFILHASELAATPGQHQLVGTLANSLDRIDLGVATAKIAVRKGVFLAETGYPIIALPTRSGPESALLLAVVRQESEFNTRAISHAGARGLMQLMPATAKGVARSIKIRYDPSRLIEDPNYNAILGSAHLRDLIRAYRGSYVLALAAYNAGGGNVRRWLRAWGDPRDAEIDVVDWIELIPINETRNYIQRVLESVQVYRYRLAGGMVLLDIREDLGGQRCDWDTAASC